MKFTRDQLRRIIKEELEERIGGTERRHLRTLREADADLEKHLRTISMIASRETDDLGDIADALVHVLENLKGA